jgi:hypothetical protein
MPRRAHSENDWLAVIRYALIRISLSNVLLKTRISVPTNDMDLLRDSTCFLSFQHNLEVLHQAIMPERAIEVREITYIPLTSLPALANQPVGFGNPANTRDQDNFRDKQTSNILHDLCQ